MDIEKKEGILTEEPPREMDWLVAESERLPQGVVSTAPAQGEPRGERGAAWWSMHVCRPLKLS